MKGVEYRVVKELQSLGVGERLEVEKGLSETIPCQFSATQYSETEWRMMEGI